MAGAVRRRQLACGLLLAVLATPVRAGAASPDWDPGDVEAAERYRALERERALRYRAAAEDRVAEPRRGERAGRGEPRAERPRVPRAEEPESRWKWSVDEWSRRLDEWGWRADKPGWRAERERAAPAERDAPLFEPWVTRLARALAEAVLRAFVAAAHDAWLSLRDGFHDWLDDAWAQERPAWTGREWWSQE